MVWCWVLASFSSFSIRACPLHFAEKASFKGRVIQGCVFTPVPIEKIGTAEKNQRPYYHSRKIFKSSQGVTFYIFNFSALFIFRKIFPLS